MFAHTASPTGAVVVHTPVECVQILTDQSEKPIKMLVFPSGETIDIYLWSLRFDKLPDFTAQFALVDDTAYQIRIRGELQFVLHFADCGRGGGFEVRYDVAALLLVNQIDDTDE